MNLSINYSDHDRAAEALFGTKSLDALKFLIDNGRELEFMFDGTKYFLSRSSSAQYVSIWGNGNQQCFCSMDMLIESATLNQIPFSVAWKKAELSFLY